MEYGRTDPSSPSRPSANAHRDASTVDPAVACPSRHGNVGVLGSAADGVPQYMARSATMGAVDFTVMPNADAFSRGSNVRPSSSTQIVLR